MDTGKSTGLVESLKYSLIPIANIGGCYNTPGESCDLTGQDGYELWINHEVICS